MIEIDKKVPNPVIANETNRSAEERIGYYVFAFLNQVLVAAGGLCFCLAVLVGLL